MDCPGHDILMATMLNGAAVMDAALLLIGYIHNSATVGFVSIATCLLSLAGNESCPQPQTSEHLAAIEIMKLKHILILQNKIDLVKSQQARDNYQQILKFVQGMVINYIFYSAFPCLFAGTVAELAPIIPISAQLKYNIDVVCEYIVKKIPVPLRDFTSDPRLIGRVIILLMCLSVWF